MQWHQLLSFLRLFLSPCSTLTNAPLSAVWSNFEIADMNLWRGPAYTDFFEYLDSKGGFYYEVGGRYIPFGRVVVGVQPRWCGWGETDTLLLVRRVKTAGDAEYIHLPCLARDGRSGGKRQRPSSRSGAIFFRLPLFALAT
jgi:hypothetical protein